MSNLIVDDNATRPWLQIRAGPEGRSWTDVDITADVLEFNNSACPIDLGGRIAENVHINTSCSTVHRNSSDKTAATSSRSRLASMVRQTAN